MNLDFQDALRPAMRESELAKMQMAEAVRQLATFRQHEFVGYNLPLYLVVGNRASERQSPTTEILEGSLRLTDFKSDGKCKLSDEKGGQFSCAEKVRYGKTLIGLLVTNLPKPKEVMKRKGKELIRTMLAPSSETRRRMAQLNSSRLGELYLYQSDLRYATAREGILTEYVVGYRAIKRLAKENPLLWVELNW